MNPPYANQNELSSTNEEWRLLSEVNLPRQMGAEKLAMELVARVIEDLHLPAGRLEQLKLAVAAATRNAIQLKDLGKSELPVSIRVLASPIIQEFQQSLQADRRLVAEKNEKSGSKAGEAKEFPYGWGFFLIDRTLEPQAAGLNGIRQRIELFIYVEGGQSTSLLSV